MRMVYNRGQPLATYPIYEDDHGVDGDGNTTATATATIATTNAPTPVHETKSSGRAAVLTGERRERPMMQSTRRGVLVTPGGRPLPVVRPAERWWAPGYCERWWAPGYCI